MKKYSLLILSVLLFLLSFFAFWYSDWFSPVLWLLAVPVLLLLLVCFVLLLVLNIRMIVKRKTWVSAAGVAVLVLMAVTLLFFPFRDAKMKLDLVRYDDERMEIIGKIKDGQLRPRDSLGNVELPPGYKRISSSGEVFLYQNNEEGQVIGFWIFRGLSIDGSIQLIYSTGGEELIWENVYPIETIEPVKENWYYVVTS